MRNAITRLIVAVVAVVTVMVFVPITAAAYNNDPSSPTPTTGSDTTDPPIQTTTPPPDPPHVPVSYVVGTYVDKDYQASSDGFIHPVTVKKAEDVSYIANKLGITTDEIKYSNPDKDVSNLNVGDTLTVPPIHGVVYKVQDGDTLSWIAYSFSADVGSIVSYNNIPNADQISPGTVFIVPNAKFPPIPKPVYTAPVASSAGGYTAPPATGNPIPYNGANHFYFGYCTWYVANRRPIPWFGDAIQWWPNARAFGYAEGRTPRVGAILVESPNHVAYVESVGGSSFVVSEMNWNAWDVVDNRTISNGDPQIVGFIY